MGTIQQPPVTRSLVVKQFVMGLGATLLFALPYLRRTHGAKGLKPGQNYLFVVNHVSLLDTILMGGLCWRLGFYPILTLGDRNTWSTSWVKRLLSGPIGFLLERGKINLDRIRELQCFGRAGKEFNLVVFPEGTRGDGIHVARCQPGLFYISQEAQMPIVPVFIANMQLVSTKTGRFQPFRGLRKVEVRFGEPIPPSAYLNLTRDEFGEFVRQKIAGLSPGLSEECSSLVPSRT